MNKLLKEALGFRGYVLSDWNGRRIHRNCWLLYLNICSPAHYHWQCQRRHGHDYARQVRFA
jgi:hypothetical protein